jgi:hypothetical protein
MCIGLLGVSGLVVHWSTLSAQDNEDMGIISIFDELARFEMGCGTVIIRQSEEIRNLVGTRCFTGDNTANTLTTMGYRIQVFAGNNRGYSRAEAFEKANEIKEVFPELSTYVTYPVPFWRLRVGDFRAIEEARFALHRLSLTFPAYAKEMYIVREDIRISLD